MGSDIRTFGLHLMLDCYGADPSKLDDVGLLYQTLLDIPEAICMNKIGFPQIAKFTEREIAGISGVIMIVESHISIHTYSKKDFLSLDAYSCKQFDLEKVTALIKERYSPREIETYVTERGKKFPIENLHD